MDKSVIFLGLTLSRLRAGKGFLKNLVGQNRRRPVNYLLLAACMCFTLNAVGQVAFVGVDHGGNNAICSTVGISWSAASGGMPGSVYWQRVVFGGYYVAMAWDATNSAVTSTGTSWAAGGPLPLASEWVSLAYGNNQKLKKLRHRLLKTES